MAQCTYGGALLFLLCIKKCISKRRKGGERSSLSMAVVVCRFGVGPFLFDGDCSELTVVFVAQSVFYNGIFLSCSLIFVSLLHSDSFVHTNLASSQVFIFGAHCFHMCACYNTSDCCAVIMLVPFFFFLFSLRIHCNRHDYHLPRAKKQAFLN